MLLYWWTHVLIHSFVWKHSLYNTRSKSRGKLWTLGNNDGSREGVSVVTNVLLCITRWEKPCLCRGREYIKTLCLPLSFAVNLKLFFKKVFKKKKKGCQEPLRRQEDRPAVITFRPDIQPHPKGSDWTGLFPGALIPSPVLLCLLFLICGKRQSGSVKQR